MKRPEGPISADFFDGETAARHEVTVTVHWQTPPALVIEGPSDTLPQRWLLDRLRGLEDQADGKTLVITQVADTADETPRDPARLMISDPVLRDWIKSSRPGLFKRDIRSGTRQKILTRGFRAIAAFLLIFFVLLPSIAESLAVLIPEEREAQFGRSVVRQMELVFGGDSDQSLRCENPEALAIWQGLAERFVDRDEFEAPITVIVLDHPMVNAFAAPGGHVVFFRGMIETAENPDEIAAVMAHEVGHVVARDPTRLALRSVGSVGVLGLVLGDFAGGGIVLALTEQLISSSYTREAEAAADSYAFAQMSKENIDPAALGTLFDRLRNQFGDIEGIGEKLVSHPSLGKRIANAEAESSNVSEPVPSLSDADWATLRATCD